MEECFGWCCRAVEVWTEDVEMHSWDSETGKRTTTVRTDNGFELVNDHGVLLRFRVDDDDGSRGMAALQRRQPTAADCEPPRYRWHLGCILLKTPAISLLTGSRNIMRTTARS